MQEIDKIVANRKYYKFNNEQLLRDRVDAHLKKINYNLELISNNTLLAKKYEYLYKIIKKRTRYLYHFINYSRDKIVNYRRLGGNHIFFVSNRYLARRYKGHSSTWNRNINIFVLLGLINKHYVNSISPGMVTRKAIRLQKEKSKKLNVNKDTIKPINFYTIPLFDDDLLKQANDIAKVMIDSNFRVNGFNKIWIIKTFGVSKANKVFPDDRYISEYSNYVRNEIEKFIQQDIIQWGYTTKERILENTIINYSNKLVFEYGFIRQQDNPKAIIEREFDRSINEILNNNNLSYRKANKELKEKFNLDTYRFIIFTE